MLATRLVTAATVLHLALPQHFAHAQAAPSQIAQAPAQAGATPTPELPVATYKGGEVTAAELRALLEQMPPEMRPQYMTPEGRKRLLEQAIRFELLAAEAKRRGYDKDERVMQQVRRAATQALIRERIDAQFPRDKVTDEEVAAYYKTQAREFNAPELRRGSHILIGTEAEAKALIEELSSKDLRAFRQAAQHKSLDEATKLRGGDLPYFDAQGFDTDGKPGPDPALAKAAFSLKTRGDVYPTPIKTDHGYSVLKLTGLKPKVERPIEAVADLIRGRLVQEKQKQALDALVDQLKTELKPQVHAELISLIEFKEENPGPVPRSPDLPQGFPTERPAVQVVTPAASSQLPQK